MSTWLIVLVAVGSWFLLSVVLALLWALVCGSSPQPGRVGAHRSPCSSESSGEPTKGPLLRAITQWFGRGRTRKIAAATLGVMVVAAGSAFAAWLIFQGASGTAGGKVGTTQTITAAISLTQDYSGAAVVPGTPGDVMANLTNNDPNAAHTLTSLSATSITATNGCNTSALHFTQANLPITVAHGDTMSGVVIGQLAADQSLDPTCVGTRLDIALTGTTTP